jgi:hypothetical protein
MPPKKKAGSKTKKKAPAKKRAPAKKKECQGCVALQSQLDAFLADADAVLGSGSVTGFEERLRGLHTRIRNARS